jgi:site-specific DNA recombinase
VTAAIYARKSTDQNGVADEQKSVTRQIENAKAYAERKGWTVDDEHVYVDDGISGAEFAARPGFLRLMNSLKAKRAPFQMLVMSEVSRLGREQIETAYALKQLHTAGVRCFGYLEDRELLMESATDKFLLSAVNFAAELEREKARQRTHDALLRKARAGHVAGGLVFGYDNVRVNGHVERRINRDEAAIVLNIFERYAAGEGIRRIAHALNAKRVPTPRAQQGRPDGWSPSTIKTLLVRDLYRGVMTWNKSRKRNAWGQKNQHARPEADWIEVPAPDLRIVSDDLWTRCQARREERTTHDPATGKRRGVGGARPAKYLLSGLLTCVCGSRYEAVMRYPHGRCYVCSAHRRKGPAVCSNARVIPVERMDAAVINALQHHALTDDFVAQVLDSIAAPPDVAGLQAAIAQADQELENLIELAASTGRHIPAIAGKIATVNGRLVELRSQLAAVAEQPDRERLRLALSRRVDDWRQILRHHNDQARLVVEQLTGGRLTMLWQDGKPLWLIELESSGLLDGSVHWSGTSPNGPVHILREDPSAIILAA